MEKMREVANQIGRLIRNKWNSWTLSWKVITTVTLAVNIFSIVLTLWNDRTSDKWLSAFCIIWGQISAMPERHKPESHTTSTNPTNLRQVLEEALVRSALLESDIERIRETTKYTNNPEAVNALCVIGAEIFKPAIDDFKNEDDQDIESGQDTPSTPSVPVTPVGSLLTTATALLTTISGLRMDPPQFNISIIGDNGSRINVSGVIDPMCSCVLLTDALAGHFEEIIKTRTVRIKTACGKSQTPYRQFKATTVLHDHERTNVTVVLADLRDLGVDCVIGRNSLTIPYVFHFNDKKPRFVGVKPQLSMMFHRASRCEEEDGNESDSIGENNFGNNVY